MNTRSPYPDTEVPEISQPRFVLDRSDERGAAVPLMGPADHGSATPLMGPAGDRCAAARAASSRGASARLRSWNTGAPW